MSTIRVMILEGHPMVRVALTRVLEMYDDIEVVWEATSGEEALVLCEHTAPDVVLMSLKLPGIDGPATIRAIKQHNPTVKVLVLTFFGEAELLTRALQGGACGYLFKDATSPELHEALQRVNAGQTVLPPAIS